MTIDKDALDHARILWDFHVIRVPLRPADFVLAMGSHDERVAVFAAELIIQNVAPLLVTSGGFGKVTKQVWKVTEGQRFADIAAEIGVPRDRIIVEDGATNSGENITRTRDLLGSRQRFVRSGILATKPYMCRRALAAAQKQWPDIDWQVASPDIAFDDYPFEEVPLDRMINLMVGDLQRLIIYAETGFQVSVDVPIEVWRSYEFLRDTGFDEYVIRK